MAKKALISLLCAATLLLSMVGCSRRTDSNAPSGDESTSRTQTENTEKGGKKSDQKSGKGERTPASGTDLAIPEPSGAEAQESLRLLRKTIGENGCCCALAFISYVSPELSIAESVEQWGVLSDTGYADAYPFLRELLPGQCASESMSELLCLVPGAEVTEVTIEKTETEDGEATDRILSVLYHAESAEPVLFGLESNGWGGSNVMVTLKKSDGTELRFNPGILCNLGTLEEIPGVFDFSLSSALNMPLD